MAGRRVKRRGVHGKVMGDELASWWKGIGGRSHPTHISQQLRGAKHGAGTARRAAMAGQRANTIVSLLSLWLA